MDDFLKNIPEDLHAPLTQAIEAVQEARMMLDEVKERFGTTEPESLRARLGETCDGIVIGEETVEALQALHTMHEERRQACRRLMEQVGGGPLGVEPEGSTP